MTFTVSINGHDDLNGDEKAAYENGLIEKARQFASDLASQDGGRVTTAVAVTNTTGSVNLLD